MKRLVFNLVTAISLLLFIVATYLWVWIPYGPLPRKSFWPRNPVRSAIYPTEYGMMIYHEDAKPSSPPESAQGIWNFCGFWFEYFDPGPGRPLTIIVIPAWLFLLGTAALPAFWTWQRFFAQQKPCPGCCQVCGYDLRATPARCPECGSVAIQTSDMAH